MIRWGGTESIFVSVRPRRHVSGTLFASETQRSACGAGTRSTSPSRDTLLVPRWSRRWPSGRGLSAAGHQTVRDSGNDLRHRLPTHGGALKPTALAAAAIRGICSVTVSMASRLKLSVHVFGRSLT